MRHVLMSFTTESHSLTQDHLIFLKQLEWSISLSLFLGVNLKYFLIIAKIFHNKTPLPHPCSTGEIQNEHDIYFKQKENCPLV